MKKLFFIAIALLGIIAINIIPIEKVNSQVVNQSKKGMVEFQCEDGSGTYWKCTFVSSIPCTITFPNDCEPSNE